MMIVQSSPALVLPDHREAGSKAGKFWVYEQAIRIPFYAIYEVEKASVAVYQLVEAHYQRCSPNERGHFAIASLGVELRIWCGSYMNQRLPWLRWWDLDGNLLLTGEERATIEQKRAERADLRAEAAERRSELLAVKLRELGINLEDL